MFAVSAVESDRIIIGSPEWIAASQWILSNTTAEMLISLTSQSEIYQGTFHHHVHDAILEVNPNFVHILRNCKKVNDLISDFILISAKKSRTKKEFPDEMMSWASERLASHSRDSELLHAAMHLAFPDHACRYLRECLLESLCRLHLKMIRVHFLVEPS
jgi:hypothetical protein